MFLWRELKKTTIHSSQNCLKVFYKLFFFRFEPDGKIYSKCKKNGTRSEGGRNPRLHFFIHFNKGSKIYITIFFKEMLFISNPL